MTARKNESMLRDERMDDTQKILKKLKIKYLDGAYPPIGHFYSVMVEELNIENPDFQGFIDKLNEYISKYGNDFACIKEKNKYLYCRTAHYVIDYLQGEFKDISKSSLQKLICEAHGRKILFFD